MIATVHGATWWLALACAVALAVWAAFAGITRRPARVALDRLILAALAAIGVGALSGLWLYFTGPPPADMLHLLYAAAAAAVLPLARSWAGRQRGDPRAFGLALAAGGVALGGILVRLGQTGS